MTAKSKMILGAPIAVIIVGLSVLWGRHILSRPPNVILIVVDTLRSDRLTQSGYPLPTTIGLQKLASQATLFTDAYATAGWTVPSTASLLTGLLPAGHAARSKHDRLSKEAVTIAETLHEAGWQTAGFSFNHHISAEANFDQGFDHFVDYDGETLAYPDIAEMMNLVGDWLHRRDPDRPFFLYLQPMNCHGPYRVPQAHQDTLFGRPPRQGFKYYGRIMRGIMNGRNLSLRDRVSEPYLASLKETYDVAVRYSVDQLAALLESLDKDVYDNTLIIFTSDHGEEIFEHEGFGHAYSLYEEVLRIPLLIKQPQQRKNAISHTRVSLLDIYPTILEILDLPLPDQRGCPFRC